MKKSVLILSALGAAAAAHAQSSVTLTGTVDVYLNQVKGSLTKRTQVSSGGNSTSKLTLRVKEDLGDGLSAGLWLESGFTADTGTFQASNTNNQPSGTSTATAGTQGLTFNRRSILFLAGPWGELHMGRDWSPMYETYTGKYDPFAVATGIAINYTAGINPNHIRLSNDIAFITPRFGGFSANIQRWFGENTSNTPTGKDGGGEGIRLQYDQDKFGAAVVFARTQFAAGDALYRSVAAVYDFGPVKISANLNHDQQGALKLKGAMAGWWVPLGLHEFKGSFSTHTTNVGRHPEAKKLALGYVYSLSKRSALYATYARIANSKGSTVAINGSTTAADRSSTGYDIGVRHNF